MLEISESLAALRWRRSASPRALSELGERENIGVKIRKGEKARIRIIQTGGAALIAAMEYSVLLRQKAARNLNVGCGSGALSMRATG